MDGELFKKHAALAVQTMQEVRGVVLDYSPDSLSLLDEAIASMRSEGLSSTDLPGVLYSFGCYLGETIVRNTAARWAESPPDYQSVGFLPNCVITPSGVAWNVLATCSKFLDNAEAGGANDLYLAASSSTG
jgi:hypothetical protein